MADRFELMGLLGFASFFLGRRKKKKLKRLADALGTAVALYDEARPVFKRLEGGGTLSPDEVEIVQASAEAMGELVQAVEAF